MNAIIGFFDILGYTNLLKQNDVGEITQKVIDIILNAKSEIYKQNFESKTHPKAADVYKFIEWRIVSDSILVYSEFKLKNAIDVHWTQFLLFSNIFQKYMFEEGLPVRGVINTGDIYIKENCFAGKPIIDAYELSKKIKMAACILHKDANVELKKIVFSNLPESSVYDLLIDYPFIYDRLFDCMLKGCTFIPKEALFKAPEEFGNSYFLNMMILKGNTKEKSIEKYVEDSFSKHNKKIDSKDVQKKIEATTNFFEACKNKLNPNYPA